MIRNGGSVQAIRKVASDKMKSSSLTSDGVSVLFAVLARSPNEDATQQGIEPAVLQLLHSMKYFVLKTRLYYNLHYSFASLGIHTL